MLLHGIFGKKLIVLFTVSVNSDKIVFLNCKTYIKLAFFQKKNLTFTLILFELLSV